MFNFIKNISAKELIILVVIIVVFVIFFGRKAILGLSKTGGEAFKEIKKIKKNFTEAVKDEDTK